MCSANPIVAQTLVITQLSEYVGPWTPHTSSSRDIKELNLIAAVGYGETTDKLQKTRETENEKG